MTSRPSTLIEQIIRAGGIGVMPTDTIYGIVGSALDKKTVEGIYRLRRRNLKKPMIVLIASVNDLASFGVVVSRKERMFLNKVWPGKVSVILRCNTRRFAYLHRGRGTIAFRLPKPLWLRLLLKKTGPLVAPSANFEGERPAKNIREARRYFGDRVAFYGDAGTLVSAPSTLIEMKEGKVDVLRRGAGRLPVKY